MQNQQEPFLFSILIANYNNGCYLQETIDCILKQDYPRWEIIIVDDGSTDRSSEIYDKYRNDSRFHIYLNDRNRGVGYTKRRCVEMANGEICAFMDPCIRNPNNKPSNRRLLFVYSFLGSFC